MPDPRPSSETLARFAVALCSLVAGSSGFAVSAFGPVQVALIEPAFGSIARRRSAAAGFGVAPSAATVNDPAFSAGASGGVTVSAPATNSPSNFVSASNGSPAATRMLAILPRSSVPILESTPRRRAGVVVSAASASSFVSPCAIASASFLRNEPLSCMRCVVSATVAPCAMKRFGFVGAWRQVIRSRSEIVSAASGETRSGACGKSIGRRSAEPVDSSVAATSAKARNSSPPPRTAIGAFGACSRTSRTRRATSSSSDASTTTPCTPSTTGTSASSAFMSSGGRASESTTARDSARQAASESVWRMSAYEPMRLDG